MEVFEIVFGDDYYEDGGVGEEDDFGVFCLEFV